MSDNNFGIKNCLDDDVTYFEILFRTVDSYKIQKYRIYTILENYNNNQ